MSRKYRGYAKRSEHSYTCGIYPTLELLRRRPQDVWTVLVRHLSWTSPGLRRIRDLCRLHRIPIEAAPRAIVRIGREHHPVVGVFGKYVCPVGPQANHVVLCRPRYMGNVGTIIRSMVGFGLHDPVLIRPAVDVFDPAVIRASMGALFRIRWSYLDGFQAYHSRVRHKCYCLARHGRSVLEELDPQPPFALVFGNEGSGLDKEVEEFGPSVRIPHQCDIDSLNLATAVGIVLYHVAGRPVRRGGL